MNLHHNMQLFSQTLRAASQYLRINLGFVEKDSQTHLNSNFKRYWNTTRNCSMNQAGGAVSR